jgi:hypothetical protein
MKIYKKIICSLILGLSIYSTQALIINEEVFKDNGGHLNQIADSLKYATIMGVIRNEENNGG